MDETGRAEDRAPVRPAPPRPARFICLEGIDGCGKSTLLGHLGRWLDDAGISHIATREPGATRLGESLRGILLDPAFAGMQPWAEVMLYVAARAEHVARVIRPALDRGDWVLADRFADATLAYQGYARGLDLGRLRLLHQWATGDLWPDCTILADCPVPTARARMSGREGGPDRLERMETAFHERVRSGYLDLAACEPHRFLVLDAGRPLPEVLARLKEAFYRRFVEGSGGVGESVNG